jgi:hypothetical protein
LLIVNEILKLEINNLKSEYVIFKIIRVSNGVCLEQNYDKGRENETLFGNEKMLIIVLWLYEKPNWQ